MKLGLPLRRSADRQSRSRSDRRGSHDLASEFDNGFGQDPLFRNQGENRILAQFTFWIPV